MGCHVLTIYSGNKKNVRLDSKKLGNVRHICAPTGKWCRLNGDRLVLPARFRTWWLAKPTHGRLLLVLPRLDQVTWFNTMLPTHRHRLITWPDPTSEARVSTIQKKATKRGLWTKTLVTLYGCRPTYGTPRVLVPGKKYPETGVILGSKFCMVQNPCLSKSDTKFGLQDHPCFRILLAWDKYYTSSWVLGWLVVVAWVSI